MRSGLVVAENSAGVPREGMTRRLTQHYGYMQGKYSDRDAF